MFNLCMLNQGRQHTCIDQIDVCIRQIKNLENEVKILEKYNVGNELKDKMEIIIHHLKRHVLSKRKERIYEPPVGSSQQ